MKAKLTALITIIGLLVTGCGAVSKQSSNITQGQTQQRVDQTDSTDQSQNSSDPDGFQTYADAYRYLVPVLASTSQIPVMLPKPNQLESKPMAGGARINAQYTMNSGYSLTLSYGPPLPVNSPHIRFGNGEFLMTIKGFSNGKSVDVSDYLPLEMNLPNAAQGMVDLGHGIVGTNFEASVNGQTVKAVKWRMNGWTFLILPTNLENNPDKTAGKLVGDLITDHFPGNNGEAVFAFGQDAPSEAVFSMNGNTYVIQENGWRAATSAARMKQVQ